MLNTANELNIYYKMFTYVLSFAAPSKNICINLSKTCFLPEFSISDQSSGVLFTVNSAFNAIFNK